MFIGPGTCSISRAVIKAFKSLVAVGGDVGFCHELTYPLEHRSIQTVSVEDLAVPADDIQLGFSAVQMKYQLGFSHGQDDEFPGLQLFEMSQQLRTEASEVWCSKNTFSFTAILPYGSPPCSLKIGQPIVCIAFGFWRRA